MKKVWSILLIFSFVLLTACSSVEKDIKPGKTAVEDKIQIGMSFDSFVIERWQRDRDVFVSTAKELGAQVNVQNANGDIDKQIEQIDYFIKKDMDVIVIICIDAKPLADVVSKAKAAGIKVIAYDRLITNSDVDLYITFDNEKVGTLMGQAIVDAGAAGGNALILGGSPTDNNVPLVEKGFTDVCEANGITIVDTMHCDGWRAELASEYIYEHEDILKNIDAIMCGNDNLAVQVINALSEKRLAGNVLVVGQDADLESCQKIVEGTQTMTVYKPVERLAKKAAECAIALAINGKLDGNDATTINDGKYDIPYIGLNPRAVTADNMIDEIIGTGFHLREDIYLNTVPTN